MNFLTILATSAISYSLQIIEHARVEKNQYSTLYIIDEFENGEFIDNLSSVAFSTLGTRLHTKILVDLLVSNFHFLLVKARL